MKTFHQKTYKFFQGQPVFVSSTGSYYILQEWKGAWKRRYLMLGKCDHCAKETFLWRNKRPKKRYCSSKCQYSAHSGSGNANWTGGVRLKHGVYREVFRPDHPHARTNYVAEHRLVAEEYLGRYLKPEERVHHINGRKNDNRPENLHVCKNDIEHNQIHASLDALIPELMERGLISFDRKSRRYVIKGDK